MSTPTKHLALCLDGTQQMLSKRKEFSLDDPQTTTGENAKHYKVGLVFI